MAAPSVKSDPIKSDRMKFQTQLVDGKPQIFFDAIDGSSTKSKSKRTSRTISNTSRLVEQQKTKLNHQKPPAHNGASRQNHKTEQPTNKTQVNEDGSSLGVYMTMDELAELVKAVKENAKNETKPTTKTEEAPVPPKNELPVVPKLDLPIDPPAPPPNHVSPREQTLSIMADKKRQKWMRDKAEIERMQLEIEYDQLKHQLSPRHKKNSVSPERSTFQYDFPPPQPAPVANKPPTAAPPLSQPPLKQNEHQHDIPPKVNEDLTNAPLKTRLLEMKQQQWKQENSEKMPAWNPFGRPGAGAPNPSENQSRTYQPISNNAISYRPPTQSDNSSSSQPPAFVHSDQTHVPAAMRRNLFFGDVRFDDDVKIAKEIERRQWLDDLHKQIEENKRKKFSQYETERGQNFLSENVQPIVQEAAQRQQLNHPGQDSNRLQQHDTLVQQTYEKMLEANNSAKYDKRLQLIEKLKRNGHQTDQLTKTLTNGKTTNETTGEKLFGPTYDSASQQNNQTKYDPLHSYRPADVRHDEAVNTVDTTFRSDHSVQTDSRIPPQRQAHPYAHEEPDLPPQIPNPHYRNSGYRNVANQPGKNNVRMRSLDDANSTRRTSTTTTYHSNPNEDDHLSQISNQRSHHRPLWNYNNPKHREYVPNSKRDPHYERRQRLKHFEQGNFDRIDDVQKKTCYNRWNSDTELQQRKKSLPPTNRVRSTNSNTQKDESILNLLKLQNKHQHNSLAGARKSTLNHHKNDEDFHSNHESSLDKYDNYHPYTQNDDEHDQMKVYTPVQESPEPSSVKQTVDTHTNQNYPQQDWENTDRPNTYVPQQPPPPPQSRQEHILQQLSAIKENLVRRQRELASSMNAIPV